MLVQVVVLGIINRTRMVIIYPLINHSIINFHCRTWQDIIYMDHRYHLLHMDMLLTVRLVW